MAGSYLARLQVRIGKRLSTDEQRLVVTVGGREVSIQSREGPLSEADWLVLQARGFPSEESARSFGEELRLLVTIAGLCSHLGLDAGRDEQLGRVNEAHFHEIGFPPDMRMPPEIHGLVVLPDDGNSMFIYMNASLSVRSDPAQLLGAIKELSGSAWCDGECPAPLRRALRLLNLAMISEDSRAKIVLAIAAVEGLIDDLAWSDKQQQWIDDNVAELRNKEDDEYNEIASILDRMHRISLRQGVFRVLDSNGLQNLRKPWDDIYGQRSSLFHGAEQPDRHQLHKFANATVKLCVTIVLSVVENRGVQLPAIACVHFPELGAD